MTLPSRNQKSVKPCPLTRCLPKLCVSMSQEHSIESPSPDTNYMLFAQMGGLREQSYRVPSLPQTSDTTCKDKSPITKLEGMVSMTFLTSDTHCKFRGLPKPPSVLIIHSKDSQNWLKAVIVMVIVYYWERIHMKMSQTKRHIGKSLEGFQNTKLPLPSGHITFPSPGCDNTHGA